MMGTWYGTNIRSERHRQATLYALRILLGENFSPYIQEVYLYGSCARGEEKYRSDVDLLVKVVPKTPARIMRRMKAEAVPDDCELPEVDVKGTSGGELGSDRFEKNVEKDRRLLWKKS